MATAPEDPEYVEGPLLADGCIEERRYQLRLADTATRDHTLVCLPTGLGKTAVSLLVTADRLAEHGGRSLLLAPTKPLVQQHAAFYREPLDVPDDEIVVFTGDVRPDDRAALWDDARVVCATPQVVENDLVGNRISLAGVVHCTFDECHRATGEYAYNYIADRYHADADRPLVTGMSASPGGDKEEILTVCDNLGLREVAVMTEDDADVEAHTYHTAVEWEEVELPEAVLAIRDRLNDVISDRLESLRELGVANTTDPNLSQSQLNRIRAKLQRLIDNGDSDGYQGMSAHAEIMKLRRAVELVETQSVESLRRYFERQRDAARSSGASKASQRFVSEPRVTQAMESAESFDDLHPKFRRTRILLARTLGVEDGERVIVFTESRDTAESLTDFLGEHFETRRFVGQGDKEGSDGMTQTEQTDTLDRFRDGEFEVLVSTSVAEEGLDVPDVDLVLFYEPVPKGIRSIQRKGRTGRASEGRVVVLMAADTRDEAFFWKSRNEEKRMETELRKLKDLEGEIEAEIAAQPGLAEFPGGAADRREAAERASGGRPTEGRPPNERAGGVSGANDDTRAASGNAASQWSRPSFPRDHVVVVREVLGPDLVVGGGRQRPAGHPGLVGVVDRKRPRVDGDGAVFEVRAVVGAHDDGVRRRGGAVVGRRLRHEEVDLGVASVGARLASVATDHAGVVVAGSQLVLDLRDGPVGVVRRVDLDRGCRARLGRAVGGGIRVRVGSLLERSPRRLGRRRRGICRVFRLVPRRGEAVGRGDQPSARPGEVVDAVLP